MADFEGLIRQALARQDAADPGVRQQVYQASRNAFAKMILSAGAQPPDVIQAQRQALEKSIERIEAGFTTPRESPIPGFRAEPPGPLQPDDDPPPIRRSQIDEDEDLFALDDEVNPLQGGMSGGRRLFAVIAILCLLAVVGWLLFTLVTTLRGSADDTGDAGLAEQGTASPAGPDQAETDGPSITILSPADISALKTAGRGRAEIITQGGQEVIRLTSVRDPSTPSEPAEPILLIVRRGIAEQIAGREVTVEIMAKSGGSGPATFAVGCAIGGTEPCGRKRFRIGLQPEAIVFTIDVPEQAEADSPAHFAISTDIGSSAATSGQGDSVDIVYARLRPQ